MAAGYTNLSVTRTANGVEWSFDATGTSDLYYWCRVVCNGQEDISEGQGTTASVTVTGNATYGTADYNAGSKTYTVTQYGRASYDFDWEQQSTATVTVSWSTVSLKVVSNGSVQTCTNIKAKSGNSIKDVIAIYSVSDGVVKPGI